MVMTFPCCCCRASSAAISARASRTVKRWIVLLNLLRHQGAFYLHLQGNRIHHLHKIGRTRRERQINTLRTGRNRQASIRNRQRIRVSQAGNHMREFSV